MHHNIWRSLPRPFFILAPMEGVTDLVFRQVIAKAGRPDLFFTEFTNVSSFASAGRENALYRLRTTQSDHPIIAQIWGKNPEHFAALSSELARLNFQGLDLNFGCPDRHVNKAGGGAAMIRTPDLAVQCITSAKSHTTLPVSVKTRLGFSAPSEFRTWLSLLLNQNLAALTIHLRTRKEMSKVPAHFELIPDILELRAQIAPATKLIINGDIKNRAHALELWQQYPNIDGFMIGRGVFADPFCFCAEPITPSRAALLDLLRLQLDLFDQDNTPAHPRSFEPLKRFFKVYLHSFDGASSLREQLMHCHNTSEVRSILNQFDFS